MEVSDALHCLLGRWAAWIDCVVVLVGIAGWTGVLYPSAFMPSGRVDQLLPLVGPLRSIHFIAVSFVSEVD